MGRRGTTIGGRSPGKTSSPSKSGTNTSSSSSSSSKSTSGGRSPGQSSPSSNKSSSRRSSPSPSKSTSSPSSNKTSSPTKSSIGGRSPGSSSPHSGSSGRTPLQTIPTVSAPTVSAPQVLAPTVESSSKTEQILVSKPSEITESQIIKQQNVTQWESAAQTQYVADLRAGNVGLATALLQPKSENTFYGNDTRNIETFLQERGYDISKPETIPDSVFSPKKSEGRNVIGLETMGDLERFEYQKDRNPDKSLIQFASSEVQQRRAEAATRYEKIKNPIIFPSEYNFNEKLIGTGAIYKTAIYGPPSPFQQHSVTVGGKTRTFKDLATAEKFLQRISKEEWTVTYDSPTKIPTMTGGVIVPLQKTKTFESKEKAGIFITELESRNVQKITTDDEFLNALRFADIVESGEVTHPRETESWVDDILYYSSAGLRPFYNLPIAGHNLIQKDQIPMKPTTFEHLIGGLIESGEYAITRGESGRPLGETMGDTWNHFMSDPLRSIVELPAEIGIALVGGKAIQSAMIGGKIARNVIITSSLKPNIATKTILAVESGVSKVKAVPQKMGSKIWEYTPEQIQRPVIKVDKILTVKDGSKIGLSTKLYYTISPTGRKFVTEAKQRSSQYNPVKESTESLPSGKDWTKTTKTDYGVKVDTIRDLGVGKVHRRSGVDILPSGKSPLSSRELEIPPLKKPTDPQIKTSIDAREIGKVNLKSGVSFQKSGNAPFGDSRRFVDNKIINQPELTPKLKEIPTKKQKTQNPIEIKSKDEIHIPIAKPRDDGVVELILKKGKITDKVAVAKVGTGVKVKPNFINLPKNFGKVKQKIQIIKNIKKRGKNIKEKLSAIEKKGYSILDKNKLEYNITKKYITTKDALSFRELKLDSKAVGYKIQPRFDKVSQAYITQAKIGTVSGKIKHLGARVKSKVTDRSFRSPAAKEIIVVRETTESTAKKSIVSTKSGEVMDSKAIPIKSREVTTDYPLSTSESTKFVDFEPIKGVKLKFKDPYTGKTYPIGTQKYTGKVPVLFSTTAKRSESIPTHGEMIKFPAKDFDDAISQGVLDTGKYIKITKGKMEKIEPKKISLKEENLEETLARRVDKYGKGTEKSPHEIQEIKTKLTPLEKPKIDGKEIKYPDNINWREPGKVNIKSGIVLQKSDDAPFSSKKFNKTLDDIDKNDEMLSVDGRSVLVNVSDAPTTSRTPLIHGKAVEIVKEMGSVSKPVRSRYVPMVSTSDVSYTEESQFVITPPFTTPRTIPDRSISTSGIKSNVIPKTDVSSIISTRTSIDTSQKINVSQSQKINTAQKTALKTQPVLKTVTELKTVVTPKITPKLKTTPRLSLKLAAPLKLIAPPVTKETTRRPGVVWMDVRRFRKAVVRTRGTRKGRDFLGNTRLGKIEGFFKRTEIISGDKKSAAQLKRDKKYREGKISKRYKKKPKDFLQKQGIISKGFKL